MKKIAISVVVLCIGASVAQASPIVDTGTPTGTDVWRLNFFEYYAGSFTTTDTVVVQSLEGYFSNDGIATPGLMDIAIHAPSGQADGYIPLEQTVLFTTRVEIDALAPLDWYGAFGLDWLLPAGQYWVSFRPTPPPVGQGVVGTMPGTAPHPLDNYLYSFTRDSPQFSYDPYYQWDDIPVDALGVRINGVAVRDTTFTLPIVVVWLVTLVIAHRLRIRAQR